MIHKLPNFIKLIWKNLTKIRCREWIYFKISDRIYLAWYNWWKRRRPFCWYQRVEFIMVELGRRTAKQSKTKWRLVCLFFVECVFYRIRFVGNWQQTIWDYVAMSSLNKKWLDKISSLTYHCICIYKPWIKIGSSWPGHIF